jgi:hypothetical protein
MITKTQIELLKANYETAREAALNAHQSWWDMVQQQKAVVNNMRSMGVPFQVAADQFQAAMDAHQKVHKAALEQMDLMGEAYKKALDEFKKQNGK